MDYREKASGLVALLKKTDVVVEVQKVRCGDYVIDDTVTVERKTARDFAISIIDGRLFRQLSRLKGHCKKPLLLIEGNPHQTDLHVDANAIRGAILSVQAIWHIPVILSESREDSIDIIMTIGRQHERHVDVVPLRGGYRPSLFKSKQLFVLQGLPGVGPTLAKRLMVRFRSVFRVMRATAGELSEVDGIGPVSAARIREVLDSEYKTADQNGGV